MLCANVWAAVQQIDIKMSLSLNVIVSLHKPKNTTKVKKQLWPVQKSQYHNKSILDKTPFGNC